MTKSARTPRSTAWHGVHPSDSLPSHPRSVAPDRRACAPEGASARRRGCLRNGNRPRDFLAAPRCGARTRCGGECRQPAMKNGRCRMHGGLSTGPRTPEGLARSRRARLTHGGYSAPVRALRAAARAHARRVRALVALVRARPAGHGVHPSKSSLAPHDLPVSKINHPAHRGHRGSSSSPAREARNQSSSVASVPSVVNPSSAGHGVDPSDSRRAAASARDTSTGVHLRSPAVQTAFPAWHGVHPSFRDRLRSSAALC
jgi:hypothetical protein